MIVNNDVDVATVGAADDAADDTTDDEDTPHARQCLCLWHRPSACWTCPCPSASMYHHWCQAARPGPYDIIVVANIDATMPDGIAVAIASGDAHTADDSTSTAVATAAAVVAIAANASAAIAVDIAVDAVHDDTDGGDTAAAAATDSDANAMGALAVDLAAALAGGSDALTGADGLPPPFGAAFVAAAFRTCR